MKKKILFLLMAMLCHYMSHSQAGSARYYLSITDAAYVPTVMQNGANVTLRFKQSALNTIQGKYVIHQFNQAFPLSAYGFMRQVYYIECSSASLIDELKSYNSQAFPYAELLYNAVPATNPPNDWFVNNVSPGFYLHPLPLEFLNAVTAWRYSQGITATNDTVVIGMVDWWVNTQHEDLKGKFKRIRSNVMNLPARYHGTQVAGLLAAATDNGKGIPSIGFHCKLDISTNMNQADADYLAMSLDGVRVVNGSFIEDGQCTSDTDYRYRFLEENVYNEIYENGTTAVFGAGNGEGLCATHLYNFPASFNHNISVTGIGSWNDLNSGYAENVKNFFKFTGVAQTFNYNTRVDMAAPGYGNYTTNYVEGDTTKKYTNDFNGTSGASPLVAGTVGLMLAAKPCLSPYQVEYILKATGYNIDTIPNNIPYAGKIGKSLMAGEAVKTAKTNFDCNDPATQTMYIDRIDINTLCAPGYASNGVRPQLIPHVVNGYGQLTYQWREVYSGAFNSNGNSCLLDDSNSATPTIIAFNSLANSPVAYYRLTVYDQSPVQKVASKIVRVMLTAAAKYDLAMRDSYVDMMDEPNSMADIDLHNWQIWQSPDIWNRRTQDDIREHENPEYYKNGDPNFMYVRVRNMGCAASPSDAQVKLYWTVAATGEQWPVDWTTRQLPAAVGGTIPAGGEITTANAINIPVLNPGDSFIVARPWNPQKPSDYLNGGSEVDVCGLARIIEPSASQSGMNTVEVAQTKNNVLKNNNVVTRNMILVNLGHRGTEPVITNHPVFVSSSERMAAKFSVELLTEKDIYKHFAGNLSEYVYVKLDLHDVYDRWAEGGKMGSYASADDETRTVLYDPATPLHLDNLLLQPGEMLPVNLSFVLKEDAVIPFDVTGQQVHFRQFLTTGSDNDGLYGDVSFSLTIEKNQDPATPGMRGAGNNIALANTLYKVFPNPVSNTLSIACSGMEKTTASIVVTDITGKVMISAEAVPLASGSIHTLNVASLTPGMYFVNIKDNNGVTNTFKITKTE